MKCRLLFAALALMAACAPKDGIKTIKADHVVNIGKIKEADGLVEFRGRLLNDRDRSNTVVSVSTGCQCTAFVPDRKIIAPGQYLPFRITYNPAYRKGDFCEAVCINYENGSIDTLFVKGTVVPCPHPMEEDCRYDMGKGLHMSHCSFFFGSASPGDEKTMYFTIGNGNSKTSQFELLSDNPLFSTLSFRQPGKMKADQRDTVHVKFTMPSGVDTIRFFVQPYVDGIPTDEKIKVTAYAEKE